jgi:hypothetical protein
MPFRIHKLYSRKAGAPPVEEKETKIEDVKVSTQNEQELFILDGLTGEVKPADQHPAVKPPKTTTQPLQTSRSSTKSVVRTRHADENFM